MAVNKKIYEYLYDITENNLKEAGEKMEVSKELFLFSTEIEGDIIDLLKLRDFDNKDFVSATYLALLQRVPDDNARTTWQERLDMPRDEFQKIVINSIMASSEFKVKNMKVKNNYTRSISSSDVNAAPSQPVLSATLTNVRKSWIFRIYSHFPYRIRVILRKLFGIDK